MVIADKTLRALRWVVVVLAAFLPLFFLPGIFSDMKTAAFLRDKNIEASLTFTMEEDRELRCWRENLSDTEGMNYLFLPSYADTSGLQVQVVTDRVDFVRLEEEGGEYQRTQEALSVRRGESSAGYFREGGVYEASFINNGKEIGRSRLTVLKSAGLPTLYVNTSSGSMDSLNADKDYKEKGRMELYDDHGRVLLAEQLKSISGRGNHTFSFDKKSYQMKLDKEADLLGMGSSDTWILLSNVYDPSYLRNRLTYEMAIEAGMPGSPESEYVDVYFNGDYAGMYLLCEKVELAKNRLELNGLEEKNEALNGGKLEYVDTFYLQERGLKGTVLANDPEDITGAYLIERDYGEKYGEATSGFTTRSGEQFGLRNPAHASEAEAAYIAGLMQGIEDAIMAPDGVNPETGKHFTEYIDLESWADKYLVEEITRNNGGGSTSSYFYKPEDRVSEKVFGGPVWDYDKAYGRVDSVDRNTQDLSLLMLHASYTRWFYYLYQHEEFVETVKEEYRTKFSEFLPRMAGEMAEAYLDEMEASAVLDRARWDYIYRGYGNVADMRGEAEKISRFLLERKEFLDDIWLEGYPVCSVTFQEEPEKVGRTFVLREGDCMERLPDAAKDGFTFAGWEREDTGERFDGSVPVTEDMTVMPVWE